jgi:hypothetical protein
MIRGPGGRIMGAETLVSEQGMIGRVLFTGHSSVSCHSHGRVDVGTYDSASSVPLQHGTARTAGTGPALATLTQHMSATTRTTPSVRLTMTLSFHHLCYP